MKRISALIILLFCCNYVYAEKIMMKILYNIPKREIIKITVNTDDQSKKIKCEKIAMKKESRELMYIKTRNKIETTITITQICNI
ncbi:hypothetical protein [Acinetobacter guillouiae]